MIDYQDMDSDLKSAGADDRTRLYFYVFAKHFNRELEKLEEERLDRERQASYAAAMESFFK